MRNTFGIMPNAGLCRARLSFLVLLSILLLFFCRQGGIIRFGVSDSSAHHTADASGHNVSMWSGRVAVRLPAGLYTVSTCHEPAGWLCSCQNCSATALASLLFKTRPAPVTGATWTLFFLDTPKRAC